jgi:hypothetical protein
LTGLAPQDRGDPVMAQVRANIVFEKMIVSVLTVAVIAGAAHFVFEVATRLFGGALSLAGVGGALFGAISFVFLFFLAGFAASLAIGIPLFKSLERAKLRKSWPFAFAAFAVSLGVLAAAGLAPSFDAPARALYLAPGLAAAFLFARKMQPLWRAADRADEAAADSFALRH